MVMIDGSPPRAKVEGGVSGALNLLGVKHDTRLTHTSKPDMAPG